MGMAAGDKAPTAQQKLMGTCNTEATGKKGDERKEFMKSCLSDGKKRQQERMKTCNVDATGKKGDERKAFMTELLKNASPPEALRAFPLSLRGGDDTLALGRASRDGLEPAKHCKKPPFSVALLFRRIVF